jgi:crotonobetaine/carnitine-CoA ligase
MKTYVNAEQRTIGYVVEDKAITQGDRTFLYFKDEAYSYRELHERSNRVANALKGMGVQKGNKVVTLLPNFPEYFYIWWGIVKLGAWEVPINVNYRGTSLADVINRSDAKVAVVCRGLVLDRFRAVQDALVNINQVVVAHRLSEPPPTKEEWNLKFTCCNLADLMAASGNSPGVKVFNYDTACIEYTSGTTGPPKGVVLPHECLVYTADMKANYMQTTAEDILYCVFPLYNGAGSVECAWTAWQSDARFVLAEGFDVKNFWNDVRKYKVTETMSVGGMAALLEKDPPSPDDRNHTLKKMYIIPLPIDFQLRFEERFGVKMQEFYGQTESQVNMWRTFDNPRLGSMGQANGGYDVRIFDENDNEVPPRAIGEIVLRPQKPHTIFKEYYKMPEKTAAKLRNCWLHTGDQAWMDEDGYFYWAGRNEESCRVRGELASVTEVEKIIALHPKVLECAAYGVPDDARQEEEVMVALRLQRGETLDPEELLRHCEKDLPYFMVPRYVRFVGEFEKSATMKIVKVKLQKEGVSPDTWDRRKAGYKLSRG